MFIGRFFIPRRLAILLGAGLVVVLAGVGFLGVNLFTGSQGGADVAAEATPLPVPSESSSAADSSSASDPSASADTSVDDTLTPVPDATPDASNEPIPEYTAAAEFLSEITVPEDGTATERLSSLAETMWAQVALLAQANARPNRIVETDLDIVAARIRGASWDPQKNQLTLTVSGVDNTLFICLPAGPSTTACTEVATP